MKVRIAYGLCALGALLLAPALAWAQTVPASELTVLPPPSINAPGAKPVAPASTPAPSPAASRTAPAAASTAIPIPDLPGAAPRDARGEPAPTVKVTKHDGKLIEEYYEGGQLYMVRVHPKHGTAYTYFVDKGHKLTRSPGAPPVNPVLYTILEWGGSGDSD